MTSPGLTEFGSSMWFTSAIRRHAFGVPKLAVETDIRFSSASITCRLRPGRPPDVGFVMLSGLGDSFRVRLQTAWIGMPSDETRTYVMSAFVIWAVTMKPATGGPHCTIRSGGLEASSPIAVMIAEVIAPRIPEAGDIQPSRLSHITFVSGPIRRALVMLIVIGSVPWKIAPNVPAVPPPAGEPPLPLL